MMSKIVADDLIRKVNECIDEHMQRTGRRPSWIILGEAYSTFLTRSKDITLGSILGYPVIIDAVNLERLEVISSR